MDMYATQQHSIVMNDTIQHILYYNPFNALAMCIGDREVIQPVKACSNYCHEFSFGGKWPNLEHKDSRTYKLIASMCAMALSLSTIYEGGIWYIFLVANPLMYANKLKHSGRLIARWYMMQNYVQMLQKYHPCVTLPQYNYQPSKLTFLS